jgi:hypothetical protein
MLNRLIRYFDLQSGHRHIGAQGTSGGSRHLPVFPQYLVVSAGVFVEPLLRKYVEAGAWQFEWSGLVGRAVFGLVIGIILLPAVYKRTFDPQRPLPVQLATLFTLGIGWQ